MIDKYEYAVIYLNEHIINVVDIDVDNYYELDKTKAIITVSYIDEKGKYQVIRGMSDNFKFLKK